MCKFLRSTKYDCIVNTDPDIHGHAAELSFQRGRILDSIGIRNDLNVCNEFLEGNW